MIGSVNGLRFRDPAMAETFEWLLDEATAFIAEPEEEPVGARARGLLTLVHASRQARALVREPVPVGAPLAVGIGVSTPGGPERLSIHRELPNPLALLCLASQRCRPGDQVRIFVQRAGLAPVERAAIWPFGLAVAEELTRPPADSASTGGRADPDPLLMFSDGGARPLVHQFPARPSPAFPPVGSGPG